MSWWKWSRTAATNATADGSINWAEGMAPSAVNDSARAMMAAAAKYRDDVSGAITTGGTSTAYTLTSYQVFDSLSNMNGAMIAFTPHATNGADATLNVDGLGAKSLRWATSAPNNVQSGMLIAGTPYVATYFNATSEWILQGIGANPYGIPLGAGVEYWGSVAPSTAFAFPFGQAISRTTYAALFSLVGTTYGVGDGSTTFNLPDKRGRLSAPLDNLGGGSSAARLNSISSTTIGAAGGVQGEALASTHLPVTAPWVPGTVSVSATGSAATGGSHNHVVSGNTVGVNSNHTHSAQAPLGLAAVQSGGSFNAYVPGSSNPVNVTVGNDSPDHSHAFSQTSDTHAGHTHAVSVTGTGSVSLGSNSGGGQTLSKLPPLIICNYIIRVL